MCYVKVEMTFDQPISFLEAELFNFEKNAFHAKENTRPNGSFDTGGYLSSLCVPITIGMYFVLDKATNLQPLAKAFNLIRSKKLNLTLAVSI